MHNAYRAGMVRMFFEAATDLAEQILDHASAARRTANAEAQRPVLELLEVREEVGGLDEFLRLEAAVMRLTRFCQYLDAAALRGGPAVA